MDEEIKDLLGEEIKSEIKDLANLQAGSKEKSTAIEDLAKLYKLRIEETKTEWDFSEKIERRIMEKEQYQTDIALKEKQIEGELTEKRENRFMEEDRHNIDANLKEKQIDGDIESNQYDKQLKKEQLEEQVKERYFRLGAEAAGIMLPLIFYAIWMKRGFKFEETGTFTSTTFRGLFSRFKPTQK